MTYLGEAGGTAWVPFLDHNDLHPNDAEDYRHSEGSGACRNHHSSLLWGDQGKFFEVVQKMKLYVESRLLCRQDRNTFLIDVR
jgi:hypothetical protein